MDKSLLNYRRTAMSNTYYKVTVTAKITCQTALHVGGIEDPKKLEKSRYKNLPESEMLSKTNGETEGLPTYRQCTHRKGSDEDISETDFYIPANTINGFIRRLATEYFSQEKISSLLGAEKSATDRIGGKLSIALASRQASCLSPDYKNGWCEKRKTLITASTRIDDRTSVAEDKYLYRFEQHPIGSTFELQLEAYYLTDNELDTLVKLLQLWENNSDYALASHKTKSWGITNLSNVKVRCVPQSAVEEYIFNNKVMQLGDNIYQSDTRVALLKPKPLYTLSLQTQQPLLVNDINQTDLRPKTNNDEQTPPKKHYYKNSQGQIVIPATTIAGVFRAELRKQVATKKLAESGKFNSEQARQAVENDSNETAINNALTFADSVIAQLFGGEKQSSCLRFKDAILNGDGNNIDHLQTLVPIDRITGAACQGQGSKSVFSVEALKPGLSFACEIYQHRTLDEGQLEALKDVLHYMSAAGLWIGGGKGRGFGLLSIEDITDIDEKKITFTDDLFTQIPLSPSEEAEVIEEDINLNQINAIYNPYAMVPLKQLNADKLSDKLSTYPRGSYPTGNTRHDITLPHCYSGMLTCRLTTMTDVFVGAGVDLEQPHSPSDSKTYLHYQRGDELAFPASSIRGMIGSVMETISQSRLRVVEDQTYSVRRTFKNSLSALGEIKYNEADNTYSLMPLTLPHARLHNKKLSFGKNGKETEKWKKVFKDIPLSECIALKPPHSRNNEHGKTIHYASPFNAETVDSSNLNFKNFYSSRGMLLGQYIDWNKDTHQAKLRVMQWHKNPKPRNYRHSIGIPKVITQRQVLSIPKKVVKDFLFMLSQAQEDLKKDGKQVARPKGYDCHLRKGQIVYFDVNAAGTEVTDLSYAAIWRKRYHIQNAYQALPDAMLPWGEQNTDLLTPAEALLGVVEEGKSGQQRNLASRLRFTDAIAVNKKGLQQRQKQGKNITLKTLSTPKLPSSNLYFSADGNTLNGRKHYLHQQHGTVDNHPVYQSRSDDNPQLKVRCNPVSANQVTTFDIHFHNLNENELKLLAASISPNKTFQHKLGLGKPLGLGSVKLAIQSVKLLKTGKQENIKSILKREKDNGEYVDTTALNRLRKLGEPIALSDGMLNYPMTEENLIKLRKNGITTRTNASGIKGIQHAEYELFKWYGENKEKNIPRKLVEEGILIIPKPEKNNE